jgi:hypothetical protein
MHGTKNIKKGLFDLTTALHVTGVIITHLQEHKTIVTAASGKRYTVIELNLLIKNFILEYYYDARNRGN